MTAGPPSARATDTSDGSERARSVAMGVVDGALAFTAPVALPLAAAARPLFRSSSSAVTRRTRASRVGVGVRAPRARGARVCAAAAAAAAEAREPPPAFAAAAAGDTESGTAEEAADPAAAVGAGNAHEDWREMLVAGAVVEVLYCGQLRFGVVVEAGTKSSFSAVLVEFGVSPAPSTMGPPVKISHGEVIAVWPKHLCPERGALRDEGAAIGGGLASDVDAGLALIKNSRPRSLNMHKVYDAMSKLPKADSRSRRTSFQLAPKMFPLYMKGPRERRAAAAVATAILIGADMIRFKRADCGLGWRALPPSVAVSRTRCSFVDICRKLLDESTPARDRAAPWSRDHLEILRELEICAASGAPANGIPATALNSLGYDITDDGAASMLLDIGYWATGTVERDGGGTTQANSAPSTSLPPTSEKAAQEAIILGIARAMKKAKVVQSERRKISGRDSSLAPSSSKSDVDAQSKSAADGGSAFEKGGPSGLDDEEVDVLPDDGAPAPILNGGLQSGHAVRGWTFPPAILAEARELRSKARDRRAFYSRGGTPSNPGEPRRNLLRGLDSQSGLRVYCIDDKNARFLDDALSIEVVKPGQLVRIYIHVADVDETVRVGSAMDELAKERGQSLYLPLKPLHMLPAAAMDAASFSTSFPTEGITAVLNLDIVERRLVSWEIFASLVPPVTRVNYDQFDAALEGRHHDILLSTAIIQDLKQLGVVAPLLAEKLDTRRNGRKVRSSSAQDRGIESSSGGAKDDVGIASVRLVRRRGNGIVRGSGKQAQVVDFRTTGSYAVVSDLLLSVSTLFRQFARRHGAFLPEDRGASMHVARCGTAPMRRYADLAIQRQIKCILFGRQPAGRRRMEELRAWLAKRHAASEKTVATRRREALYISLADHCTQQQQAAGLPYAMLTAHVRSVNVTRRRAVRADVSIDGTGLQTVADVAESVVGETKRPQDSSLVFTDPTSISRIPLRGGDRVQIRISQVDTVAQKIVAEVIAVLD